MLEIQGKIIEEPIIDILYDLRRDLLKHNINKLSDIIVKGANATITCPSHKNGLEQHPSCQVRLTEDNSGKAYEGCVHCFTCNYNANFQTFVSNCFGIDDGGKYGEKWLLEHFRYSYLTSRRDIKKIEPKKIEIKKQKTYIKESELKQYRFYHPYMFERKLTHEVINKYDIGFDKNTNSLTFPVYDINGKCSFLVRRNVSFKKFYIPEDAEKEIFGLYQIPEDCNEIIICESVINACTCAVYGKVGIALFGTGSEQQIETLKNLPIRKYILAFDGDKAGQKATKKFQEQLGKTKLVQVYKLPIGKDINDLSKEEFDKLEIK